MERIKKKIKSSSLFEHINNKDIIVGLSGLGVTCSPRDPRFVGSNPAEVDGFYSGYKNPEHKSSKRDFKLGVPSLRFLAR